MLSRALSTYIADCQHNTFSSSYEKLRQIFTYELFIRLVLRERCVNGRSKILFGAITKSFALHAAKQMAAHVTFYLPYG